MNENYNIYDLNFRIKEYLETQNVEFISLSRRGSLGADLAVKIFNKYRILKVFAKNAPDEIGRDKILYEEVTKLLSEIIK